MFQVLLIKEADRTLSHHPSFYWSYSINFVLQVCPKFIHPHSVTEIPVQTKITTNWQEYARLSYLLHYSKPLKTVFFTVYNYLLVIQLFIKYCIETFSDYPIPLSIKCELKKNWETGANKNVGHLSRVVSQCSHRYLAFSLSPIQ